MAIETVKSLRAFFSAIHLYVMNLKAGKPEFMQP